MTLKAIIIEDETYVAMRLRRLLNDYKDVIEVVEVFNKGIAAIEYANEMHPDVLFLDIHLPGVKGTDLMKALNYAPKVVFVTAYDMYAIEAFDSLVVDYILKPVTIERLKLTIQKLLQFQPNITEATSSNLDVLHRKNPTTITVKDGEVFRIIAIQQISYLKADNKYVTLHLLNGRTYLVAKTLSAIEAASYVGLIRIHRSIMINKSHILTLKKSFKGRIIIVMNDSDNTVLHSSASYGHDLRVILGIR